MRPAFFCAYMRWSAIRSASATSAASSGSSIAPYEQPISKPSPCSDSAAAAPMIERLGRPRRPACSSAQNSSPPMRKADAAPAQEAREAAAEPHEQRVAGGVAERVVVVLEAVEVEEHEHERLAAVARGSSRSSTRASARRLPRPVSASVCASSREARSIATLSRKVSIVRAITASSEAAASPTATGLSSATQP